MVEEGEHLEKSKILEGVVKAPRYILKRCKKKPFTHNPIKTRVLIDKSNGILICGEMRGPFCVGEDNQSLYSRKIWFRGTTEISFLLSSVSRVREAAA